MPCSMLVTRPYDGSSNGGNGGCPWQYDKTAFKGWIKTAMSIPHSRERKELYSFLAECFLDADSDRDGLVRAQEFDGLCESAVRIPRRFGLAPGWSEMYVDVAERQALREQMFRSMDKHGRGMIGMDEWIAFSLAHVAEKVRTMQVGTPDFCQLERAG